LSAVPEKTAVGGVTVLGLDTSFGRMASGSGDFNAQYERERQIFRMIRELKKAGS
jgi:hypothetical protein